MTARSGLSESEEDASGPLCQAECLAIGCKELLGLRGHIAKHHAHACWMRADLIRFVFTSTHHMRAVTLVLPRLQSKTL
ncbi:MAG: hypothetical protein EB015_08330 [Methylocystaceae bacterium]|nr:hypothetical protein [Methylocystaceae bacterium]